MVTAEFNLAACYARLNCRNVPKHVIYSQSTYSGRRVIRFIGNFALSLLMIGVGGVPVGSSSAAAENLSADAIVLRIEVLENVFTDFCPRSDCREGKRCIELYGWAKYRAHVREVISGDWRSSEVTFARLEHASFVNQVTRDCYVILRHASPDFQSKLHVPFIAEKLLSNLIESDRPTIKDLREVR